MSLASSSSKVETNAGAVDEPALPETGGRALATSPNVFAVYLALMKPKIISLLLVTTLGAMMVAAKGLPSLALVFWTMLGGALSAGGANAVNHVLDRDIDAIMYRTNRRPVPAGHVSPTAGIIFGIILILVSFILFYVMVNPLAAALSLIGALYYIFIYTIWLKRSTYHNITIGGVCGAIPPLVGWAAVTGELSLTAWALFGIVFLWTPPHTWALTLVVKRDYARVDVPMLPVVKGEEETRRQIVIYSWVYIVFTLLLTALGIMGWLYLLVALVIGAIWMHKAYEVRREKTKAAARRLYKYSLLHLALLFLAMIIDVQLPPLW
ncbi:MAG: protoheme IX farnesyltransferase [Chloroflexi bacterium]|nr:protoheme IX farnesyltransferase [Chloroflexota bacterium]